MHSQTHSPPPGQQKGELIDVRLALQGIRLSSLQLHSLVFKSLGDVLEHLDGHTQWQEDGLVERGQLIAADSLLVKPVEEVADLQERGHQQEEVPGEDIGAAHGQPAPQGEAQEGGGEEAEDEEGAEGPAASHVAQEQDGVPQVVDGPLCVVAPTIAQRWRKQAVPQGGVVCTHVFWLFKRYKALDAQN